MADYPSLEYKVIDIESNQVESQHVSESGVMQARKHGGQRFKMVIEHPPLTKAQMMPINAYIESLQGESNEFTISLPMPMLGAVSGSPVTNSARAGGSNSIAIDNLVASVTSVFVAGDWINFNNHSKGYKIVSTVDSEAADAIAKADSTGVLLKADGSGDKLLMTRANQAHVTIFPPLVEPVPDGTGISFDSAFTFTVELSSGSHDYMVEPPNIYKKQIEVIESIS